MVSNSDSGSKFVICTVLTAVALASVYFITTHNVPIQRVFIFNVEQSHKESQGSSTKKIGREEFKK
jgi:hypothetical protein